MHGRATRVVLPVLVVLALVAVVAIASTGSTPGGSGRTRAPSESLFDTIYSLGLLAVLAGGVLLVYGLTQRKAIARELATGRYRRTSLLGFLVFVGIFVALSYWRLQGWTPLQAGADEEGFAFPGPVPVPTTPENGQTERYEPSVSWPPIAVVVGLIIATLVAYFVAERRARGARGSGAVLAEQLAAALDETLDDLRAESDPRRAIIAAYARLERVLAANGVPRRAAETPDEYLVRVLGDLELTPEAIGRLTALFEEAKFSHHDMDATMKESAIAALEQIRDELRARRDELPAAEPPTARAATS